MIDRRRFIAATALLAPTLARPSDDAEAALRDGGVAVVLRHARAPGTFDPPRMRLGDCSTQRNLDDEGRTQARRIGQWFAARQLAPGHVRSSPWCRCVDTATLAFGRVDVWAALGSPHGGDAATNAAALRDLRTALTAVPRGRFDVWVTHDFVVRELVGASVQSSEALVVRHDDTGGAPRVVARIAPP